MMDLAVEGFRLASWQGLATTVMGLVGLAILHFLWTAVYTIFFHPLSKYPGPWLWLAFPWLKSWALIRGKAEHAIVKHHDRLGPIVRVQPNTLSFTTLAAWKDIYGTGHAELPKYILPGSGMEERPNIITANSRDHHRFRRALAPAFTNEALAHQEGLISSYVDQLVQRLREIAKSNKPVADISRWLTITTFDIFGDLSYGESFKGLESGKLHPWIVAISNMKGLVPMLVFPRLSWLLIPLLTTPGERVSLSNHQQSSMDLTYKRIKNKDLQERGDFMTCILRDHGGDHGLTDYEMACNADILISAGSETTGSAMTGIMYFLISNPDKLAICVKEIRSAFDTEESIKLKDAVARLPYMTACIEEGLRLYPPVPSGGLRVTLPGRPTIIDGRMIPEKTVVCVPQLATYISHSNFHDARNYHPERWLPEVYSSPSSPFHDDNRDCVKPFLYGPRSCIGKNLAYFQMRLILAKLLWNFDFTLGPGNENWALRQRAWQLWEKPTLMMDVKLAPERAT